MSDLILSIFGTVPNEYMFIVYFTCAYVLIYFIYKFFGLISAMFNEV